MVLSSFVRISSFSIIASTVIESLAVSQIRLIYFSFINHNCFAEFLWHQFSLGLKISWANLKSSDTNDKITLTVSLVFEFNRTNKREAEVRQAKMIVSQSKTFAQAE